MGWALLGASSLLIGALIAFAVRIADRLLGFILAFGAGVLISAVAYELIEEASRCRPPCGSGPSASERWPRLVQLHGSPGAR